MRHTQSGIVHKSAEEIRDALIAYGDWCDRGCKYREPGIKADKRLSYKSRAASFYTWTWVTDIQDLKFFSHNTLRKRGRDIIFTTRVLTDADEALIDKLESVTGYEHSIAFDSSTVIVTIQPLADEAGKTRTKVTSDAVTVVSGLASMFKGRVKDGMKESADAMFAGLRQ